MPRSKYATSLRLNPEARAQIEEIRDAIEQQGGFRPDKSKVLELAVRHLWHQWHPSSSAAPPVEQR